MKIEKLFARSLILGPIAVILFLLVLGVNVPSSGSKVGQIVRINREGILNKTWEAQLIRGGFSDGSGIMGRSFEFTVTEGSGFIPKLEDAMRKQSEVRIQYKTIGIYPAIISGSGGTFLIDVEVVK
jgi:hypothetical protein